ncbi:MAG TPA: RDD family protein [Blastocatellia bacterium]|nr:RDD family protein [Blastocatellia bacterium]
MNPKRAQSSRLIEFPRKARAAVEKEPISNPLPAWRKEVNERVRAAKARRNLTPDPAPVQETAQPVSELDYDEANRYEKQLPQRTAPITTPQRPARSYTAAGGVESSAAAPARTAPRTNDTIVEAALTRVRRASENASRASLPKIEPARPAQPAKSPIVVDREATARALEPAVEVPPKTKLVTTPLPRINEEPAAPAEPLAPAPEKAEPRLAAPKISAEPIETSDPVEEITTRETLIVLDEMEPVDYLAAEINKVAAGDEFAHDESPSLFTHVVIGLTDLFTIALSSTPFLALIEITNGNYAFARTRGAVAAVVFVVATFYLALTQSLCGKTFGMMLTNTRVVDARTFEPITAGRAMLRTLGYYVAFAPAMIGLLWPALNRKRRAWQDYIAGTLVARDF